MEFLAALVFAASLIYALGREHGGKQRRRSSRRDSSDWSPFDDFYSDR